MGRARILLLAWAGAACVPTADPSQTCDPTPLPPEIQDVYPIDAQVTLDATLYVWRGACPEPGQEDGTPPVASRTGRVEGRVVELAAQVPFSAIMRPPQGPRAEYCARIVYVATGEAQSGGHWSAWPRSAFSALRVGHQDTTENFQLRPYGSECAHFGPLQGGGVDADPALYDPDHDGIPTLRELQLALRPRDADSMLLQRLSGADRERTLDAVDTVFGEDAASGAFGSEGPRVNVHVPSFRIDETEVTNRQYRVCMGLPVRAADGTAGWTCDAPALGVYESGTLRLVHPSFVGHPVVGVTHAQAERFCQARGARLPTEVEWERAAREQDGTQSPYPWGFQVPQLDTETGQNRCELGVFTLYAGDLPVPCEGASRQDTRPAVGTGGDLVRQAQNNDLVDMAGNVAEWTADHYTRDLHEWLAAGNTGPWVNPAGGNLYTVRGGSFRSGERFVRTYARAGVDDAAATYEDTLPAVGFRCAR